MKSIFQIGLLSLAFLATISPRSAEAAQASCTIEVPAIDSGFYDVYGDRDARQQFGFNGFGAGSHVSGPSRSFLAFHIPQFTGTITNATVWSAQVYSISPNGSETLQLREVTTPVNQLRKGGFGLTNIYNDLADGTLYGSQPFYSGYWY